MCVFSVVCALAGCGGRAAQHPSLVVTPRTGTFDVPFTIRAQGLPKNTPAIVSFSGKSKTGVMLRSAIETRTDAHGDVVLHDEFAYADMSPTDGSLVIWPEHVAVRVDAGTAAVVGHASRMPLKSVPVTTTDERPAKVGFYGEWYTPAGARRHTAILLFGGSDGGLNQYQLAQTLAAHGYPVLHLAYFSEPGLPDALIRIPLEYFQHALEWLAQRPQVDPKRIVTWGASRGGEASLILASTFPRLVHAAVAYVPSAYVIPSPGGTGAPAWTYKGKPLPEYSVMPVWKSSGPIFAVGGYDDRLWPSGEYVSDVRAEMHTHGRRDVTALTYEHAGHLLANAIPPQLPQNPVGYGEFRSRYGLLVLGGSPQADEAALEKSWPILLRFLARI